MLHSDSGFDLCSRFGRRFEFVDLAWTWFWIRFFIFTNLTDGFGFDDIYIYHSSSSLFTSIKSKLNNVHVVI